MRFVELFGANFLRGISFDVILQRINSVKKLSDELKMRRITLNPFQR